MQKITYTLHSGSTGKAVLVTATFEMVNGKAIITPCTTDAQGNPVAKKDGQS